MECILGRHINDKACRGFIDTIGETMVDNLDTDILGQHKGPLYFSLLFDGSADKAFSEKEIVTVKVLNNGLPEMRLLGIAEPDNSHAEAVYQSIIKKCQEHGLKPEDSLVAAAADGASINTGQYNGVFTKLTQTGSEDGCPWMLKIHCVPHRMELGIKDAFHKSYFNQIDKVLVDLYYMFKRSPKKWRELKRLGTTLGVRVTKLARGHGTRWVAHRKSAVQALDHNYEVLVSLLEDMASGQRKYIKADDQAKMKGYLKIIKSTKFVFCLAFYADILGDLSHLSLIFQSNETPIFKVRASTEATLNSIREKETKPGKMLQQVMGELSRDEFRGHTLSKQGDDPDHTGFHKLAADTIINIVRCVDSRLRSFAEDVFVAADILDPTNYPSRIDKEGLMEYGNNHVQILTDHFQSLLIKQGCEINKIHSEWTQIKLYISRNHIHLPAHKLWQKMIVHKSAEYSNFLHLVHILLVCPIASAQVERQFSAVKRILGEWRLTLGLKTIETLLRISTEGPQPEDFAPESAVDRWWQNSTRSSRPHTKPLHKMATSSSDILESDGYTDFDSDSEADITSDTPGKDSDSDEEDLPDSDF